MQNWGGAGSYVFMVLVSRWNFPRNQTPKMFHFENEKKKKIIKLLWKIQHKLLSISRPPFSSYSNNVYTYIYYSLCFHLSWSSRGVKMPLGKKIPLVVILSKGCNTRTRIGWAKSSHAVPRVTHITFSLHSPLVRIPFQAETPSPRFFPHPSRPFPRGWFLWGVLPSRGGCVFTTRGLPDGNSGIKK